VTETGGGKNEGVVIRIRPRLDLEGRGEEAKPKKSNQNQNHQKPKTTKPKKFSREKHRYQNSEQPSLSDFPRLETLIFGAEAKYGLLARQKGES
jgi:hypothetical protein